MKRTKFNFYKTLFLVLSIMFFVGGCEDNLVEAPKGLISPDNFYNNITQIEGVLQQVPRRHKAMHQYYRFWIHDDQHWHPGGNLVIPPDQGTVYWERQYTNIMNLNFAIKAIQNGSVQGASQAEIDKLTGEAYFWRAWCYSTLVCFWGDIPILTEEDTDSYFTAQPGRSPISEVYDLIISDYNIAIEKLLPKQGVVGRPNLDIAKAYLAKAYLTMATNPMNKTEYYSKAAELLWEVIQDGRYSLVEDVNKVFSYGTKSGPEAMLSICSNKANLLDWILYISHMNGGWASYCPSNPWLDQFPDQPRKGAYLDLYDKTGKYHKDLNMYAGIKKWMYGWDAGNKTDADLSLLRYADVLLMYAEAANMANGSPTENAVWAINQIISRANGNVENPNDPLATINMTKEAFDEKVIDQRNWEFCFEPAWGRTADLFRKRLLEKKIAPEYQKNVDVNDYLWPIPEKDLRLNPNLTQNPGYPVPVVL